MERFGERHESSAKGSRMGEDDADGPEEGERVGERFLISTVASWIEEGSTK